MTNIPASIDPILDEAGLMQQDIECMKCQYSLHGLTEERDCPECGTPVRESLELHRQRRTYFNQQQLERMTFALILFVFTPVGLIFGLFVSATTPEPELRYFTSAFVFLATSVAITAGCGILVRAFGTQDFTGAYSSRHLANLIVTGGTTGLFGFLFLLTVSPLKDVRYMFDMSGTFAGFGLMGFLAFTVILPTQLLVIARGINSAPMLRRIRIGCVIHSLVVVLFVLLVFAPVLDRVFFMNYIYPMGYHALAMYFIVFLLLCGSLLFLYGLTVMLLWRVYMKWIDVPANLSTDSRLLRHATIDASNETIGASDAGQSVIR